MAGKPHHGGVGQVNAVVIAALLHGGVADLGCQHAHDAELIGAKLDGLAHRISAVGRAVDSGVGVRHDLLNAVAAKGRPVQVIANDADLLVVLHIHILQAASLCELVILHLGVVLVHTAYVGPAVAGGTDLQRTAGAAAHFDLR